MFCLAKPTDFCRAVYQSSRLKFILAWVTFGGLFIPTALLTSLGFPEKYALPLMLIAIPPFQYTVFCILKGLNLNDETVVTKTEIPKFSVLKIVGADAYYQAPESKEKQLYYAEYLNVRAERLGTDLLQAQVELVRAKVEMERSMQALLNLKIDVVAQILPDLETKIRHTLMQNWIKGHVSAVTTFTASSLSMPIRCSEIGEPGRESRDTLINLQRKSLEMRPGSIHLRGMLLPTPAE